MRKDETFSWFIQVLASATSPEQMLSAETFFSCQNGMSTGFDKFWSRRVLRYVCNRKAVVVLQGHGRQPLKPSNHYGPCKLECMKSKPHDSLTGRWSFFLQMKKQSIRMVRWLTKVISSSEFEPRQLNSKSPAPSDCLPHVTIWTILSPPHPAPPATSMNSGSWAVSSRPHWLCV